MLSSLSHPLTQEQLTSLLLSHSIPSIDSVMKQQKKEPAIYIAHPTTQEEIDEAAAFRREMGDTLHVIRFEATEDSKETYTNFLSELLIKEAEGAKIKPIVVDIILPEGVHCACNAADGILVLESDVVAWEHKNNGRVAFDIRCRCCAVPLENPKPVAQEPPALKKRYIIRIVSRAPSSGSESSNMEVFDTLEEASIYAQKYLTDTCNFYGWRDDKGWDSWKDIYEEGASRPTPDMGSLKTLHNLLNENRYDALIWGPENTFRGLVPDEIRITETS